MDQENFAGASVGDLMQRVIRGAVRNPDTCTLGEADFFGQRMNLTCECQRVVGIGARDCLSSVDAVAGLHFGDAFADGLNGAGCV